MKAGDTARVKMPVIQGEVKARRFNDQDVLEFLLEYVDEAGEVQQRWFTEAQLEEVN